MSHSNTLARDFMNATPPYCHLDTPVSDIAGRFAAEDISGMLVIDEEKRLLGVITESDLIDQQKNLHVPTAVALFDMVIPVGGARFEEELERMQAMRAESLMHSDVLTVDAAAPLHEVASIMGDRKVHHLPVLDGESVVGMICKHDVIKALVGAG